MGIAGVPMVLELIEWLFRMVLPYWRFITAVVMGLCAFLIDWRKQRPARWRAAGRCARCGYPLPKKPPWVCPECGRLP